MRHFHYKGYERVSMKKFFGFENVAGWPLFLQLIKFTDHILNIAC